MTDHAPAAAPSDAPLDDDLAAAFQIEGWPVRGRLVRLGSAIDAILSAHAYPEPVAALLGEACALAALIGSALKFEGRLIVQAQGAGPVRYVVADYDTQGHLRGYCRFDEAEVAAASQGFVRPGAKTLLGEGVFVMTLDRGADFERTQGITPIEGESLSLAAEHYFQQSEQIPTRVRLAVGAVTTDAGTLALSPSEGAAAPAEIRFDFAHSIALRSLTIHAVPDPLPHPRLTGKSAGRWQLQALDGRGRVRVLGRQIEIDGRGSHLIPVDTGGVPYRTYRLQGEDGYFPTETWLTEVTFTTAPALLPYAAL